MDYNDREFTKTIIESYLGENKLNKAIRYSENYIKQYSNKKGWELYDCWSKGRKDEDFARELHDLSYAFHSPYSTKKQKTYENRLLILSAAWESESSKFDCDIYDLEYREKPSGW